MVLTNTLNKVNGTRMSVYPSLGIRETTGNERHEGINEGPDRRFVRKKVGTGGYFTVLDGERTK